MIDMINTGLEDRVVLVTGANHGIGAATAKAFAAEGARVFINYLRLSPEDYGISEDEANQANTPGSAFYRLRQAASADEVVQEIRDSGGQAEAWEADLADPATIPQLLGRAEEAFGPVEVLVNNATHCRTDTFIPQSQLDPERDLSVGIPTLTITAEGHDQHFAVNSRAVALMMAEFACRHVQRAARWGRIINISTDGASAFSGEISYGASKHALESYSRAAADELGPYGITVNILSPGPVQTGYILSELEEKLIPEIPLRRIGQPEDIADVIVFLASEQARWITGQLLYVGGGHVMPL
jgi:3-oxoacyl-[acyl-carrier protein] reductase